MFNHQADEAGRKLAAGSISFRRKGGGYYYPDRIVDRNMIALVKVRYRPTRSEDEVLAQFADKAWVDFGPEPEDVAEGPSERIAKNYKSTH
jgi:hypothetical protein